jgi:hypothetical protein
MKNKSYDTSYGRRKFLASVTKLVGTSIVIAIPGKSIAERVSQTKSTFTVKQIIDTILKEIHGAPFATTVESIKIG